jgi:hypothetical protein
MKTDIHLWWYVTQFFLEWEMFQAKVVEKIKTHISCPKTIFRKSCRLWDNVEKFCKAGQATDDNFSIHWKCSKYTIKGAPRPRFPIIWVKRFLNDTATSTASTRLPIHKIPITIKSSTYMGFLSYAILRFILNFTFYILIHCINQET